METTQPTAPSKTSPKDFFLWLGAIIALYGSIISFISLVFEYINYVFPDALASYGDPYGGAVRSSMAALIVFVPTTVVLMQLLRSVIIKEPGKAGIWVRRWALGLTLFLATATILIDLITLINTFLGGEITARFALKVLTVLAVALFIFFHTLVDMRGYWITHGKRAIMLGGVVIAVALITVIAGFFIIGSPSHIRQLRLDSERVSDLQSIQYQLVYYYQQKQVLPATLETLNDPLSNFIVPTDPQTGASYGYEAISKTSFKLCATFNAPAADMKGRGAYEGSTSYPSMDGGMPENWQHEAGETCFERTIDPERYPPIPAATRKPL